MSIATMCNCGATRGICMQLPTCPHNQGQSLQTFFIENNCTDDERNKIKAFLFVLRHPNLNWDALENIIKKYEDILIKSI